MFERGGVKGSNQQLGRVLKLSPCMNLRAGTCSVFVTLRLILWIPSLSCIFDLHRPSTITKVCEREKIHSPDNQELK